MSSNKILVACLSFCLAVAVAHSAPTEPDASTTPMAPETSTPATTDKATSGDTTESSSMAVSSAQDHSHVHNTSFTCFNRPVGYYADIDSACKVYHFCMLGDYNGQEVYQRISYLCLNDTIFDQQALDCVDGAKLLAPCADSAKYYDESNTILRKAMIGKASAEVDKSDSAPTSAATFDSTTASADSSSTTTQAAEAPGSTEATTSTTTAESS